MSDMKKYKIFDLSGCYEVVLEVDHTILTPPVAEQINKFFSCWEDRVEEQNGNHSSCVIRLAGEFFINAMLKYGGAQFGSGHIEAGASWTSDLSNEEGWPKEHGIRVVSAIVEAPEYDSLTVVDYNR